MARDTVAIRGGVGILETISTNNFMRTAEMAMVKTAMAKTAMAKMAVTKMAMAKMAMAKMAMAKMAMAKMAKMAEKVYVARMAEMRLAWLTEGCTWRHLNAECHRAVVATQRLASWQPHVFWYPLSSML